MSIQGALNQAAGVGAALYTQTPGYAIKKEEKLKQKELQTSKAQLEALKPELEKEFDVPKEGDAKGVGRYITSRLAQEKMKEQADVLRQRIFDLNPNAATAGDLYANKTLGELSRNPKVISIGEELTARQDEANGKGFEIVQARAKQKTRYTQHMANWGKGKRPKAGEINGK